MDSRTHGLTGSGRAYALAVVGLAAAIMLCGWTTGDYSSESADEARPRSAVTPGLHLPPGSRALTPCATTMDPLTHEPRCAHRHAGKHLRTSPGASVTLLPSGLAHIVEPCGGDSDVHSSAETACNSEDPYVLWYVMAMPAPPPGTPPGLNCPNTSPYAPFALDPATSPNPNNPDPLGIQPLVTRHWPNTGAPVTYIISIPPTMSAGADIFAGALSGGQYPWTTFTTQIETLMNGVSAIATANTPPVMRLTSYPAGMATPDYYNFVGPIIANTGQFLWAWTGPMGGCGGPTGNGVNEFTFVSTSLGGVTGGLTSMLVNPSTGVISECDVIFEVAPGNSVQWNGLTTQAHTGLAHEVGHFWGLDHTNLHKGGSAALTPMPPSIGIAYGSSYDLPAMVASHTTSVTIPPASDRVNDPWRPDDIAAFSALYPVNTIAGSKLPMINTSAVITGRVIDSAAAGAGVFGMNAYVVRAPVAGIPPLTPSQMAPAVGAITGTARPDIYAITGVLDTATGARCTGDFRIDGIPAMWGAYYDYTLYMESPASSNFGTTLLGEWWFESTLNPVINIPAPTAIQVACTGTGQTPALQISSMAVSAGTIIRLERPIDIQASATNPIQICNVSRPLVHVSPRTSRPAPGTLLSIIIWHNRTACTSINPITGPPLQSITCTWNGQKLPVTLISTNSALPVISATVPIITQYTVTVPAGVTFPGVVEVTALEVPGAPGAAPSAVGRNTVIY